MTRALKLLIATLYFVALGGCAETEFLAHATKEIRDNIGLDRQSGKTVYKVGNPYEINGVWYYPKVDYDYTETGIASWYGPNFHGKKTANGEVFDMNEVSAAHRTLPLPSFVRVTNLNSGRAINVRINDRGPFAHGRIIDLSRRAAQLLGFERAGTAPVRVDILAEESRQLALSLQQATSRRGGGAPKKPDAAPTVSVTSSALPPPQGAKAAKPESSKFEVAQIKEKSAPARAAAADLEVVDGRVSSEKVAGTPKIFVQAGAFSQFQNAHKVRAVLKQLGPTKITQVDRSQGTLFRVRIGPLRTVGEADQILASVIKAGYPDAATVIE